MIKRLTTAALFLTLFAGASQAQENPFPKFKIFKEVIPGIDFFASEKSNVDPFVKPIADARQKLTIFLGNDIAKGAIFVCSTLAQKDSIYDVRAFKLYKWYLIQLTPEAQREERLARMQAQQAANAAQSGQADQGGPANRGNQASQSSRTGRGDQGATQTGRQGGPPGGGGQSPDMRAAVEARAAATLASQVGYAILMTSLNNQKPFRASRLDDMSRSPLNDWLDIALVAYATGSSQNSYRTIQDRVDDCFPLDDVLSMSRPFVANIDQTSGGGGGMSGGAGMFGVGGMGPGQGGGDRGGASQGGARAGGQSSGGRGGSGGAGGRVLTKDVVDRMVFDAQAAAFFNYFIEKAGLEKMKDLVQQNRNKTETLQVVIGTFGPDVDKTEQAFMDWVKAHK